MPETAETCAKRSRRSEDELKAELLAKIARIEERQKERGRGALKTAKAHAESFIAKYPTTKSATFANQAVALLEQAISQA